MAYEDIMNPVLAGDVCRVTVVGPRHQIDLALPAGVPFAQLFAAIAHFSQLDSRESPSGWVLQRLGERPLPPSLTPAAAGLLDGELIYLRPRAAALPEMMSDDIADEIAGVHGGAGRWTSGDARRVAFAAGGVALAAGGGGGGPPGPPPPAGGARAGGGRRAGAAAAGGRLRRRPGGGGHPRGRGARLRRAAVRVPGWRLRGRADAGRRRLARGRSRHAGRAGTSGAGRRARRGPGDLAGVPRPGRGGVVRRAGP